MMKNKRTHLVFTWLCLITLTLGLLANLPCQTKAERLSPEERIAQLEEEAKDLQEQLKSAKKEAKKWKKKYSSIKKKYDSLKEEQETAAAQREEPLEVVEIGASPATIPSTPKTSQPTGSETPGMRNALKEAKAYLNYSAFSYTGLIEQLEFSGYTHEDAVYAADNCGADWMEQAYKDATAYLRYTSFSLDGLIEQLEYSGFTHEEAVYGANAAYNEY